MTGLLGVIAGAAAVLAVVVTSLIGVCLAVVQITDAVRGRRPRGASGDACSVMPASAGGRHRGASGGHVASGRGGR